MPTPPLPASVVLPHAPWPTASPFETPRLQRSNSGRGPGLSRPAVAGPSGRQQPPPPQQRRAAAAAGGQGGGGSEVIDLTSDSPPQEDGELQIVHSTVQRVQRGPMRGVKRPRPSPQQQAAQQLSPMKAMLVQAARAAAALPPPPPPPPEPEGPKCGICFEVSRLAEVLLGLI